MKKQDATNQTNAALAEAIETIRAAEGKGCLERAWAKGYAARRLAQIPRHRYLLADDALLKTLTGLV